MLEKYFCLSIRSIVESSINYITGRKIDTSERQTGFKIKIRFVCILIPEYMLYLLAALNIRFF